MKYILIRYGELTLKGKNRNIFENQLLKNIKIQLQDYNLEIKKDRNRIYINQVQEEYIQEITNILKKIPGIHSFAIANICSTEIDVIKQNALDLFDTSKPIFKVKVKRLNKGYPINSNEIAKDVGAHILKTHDGLKDMKVKMKDVDQEVMIEIHRNNAYVYHKFIKGIGGLPIGTAGKAVVFLSGGIDSPVSAIMAMKRGLKVDLIHFSSPPYTTEDSLNKVKDLYKVLFKYDQDIKLYNVNIGVMQQQINQNCRDSMQIIILRRMMVRFVDMYQEMFKAKAIVTGENLSQVASQTLANMDVVNQTSNLLILRPLLTYDKDEIIIKAKEYNTYDISIRPFADCCVIFVPKAPITNAKVEIISHEEERFDYSKILKEIEIQKITKDDVKENNILENLIGR